MARGPRLIPFAALVLLSLGVVANGQTATPSATSTPATSSPVNGYVFPDAKERRKRYFKGMFGPVAVAKTIFSAGLGTARNTPEEWGGQWKGFGKRIASNFGRRAISNSVTYGLGEAFKLDSHYYPSKNKGFKQRLSNAFISQFTARKPNGKRVVGFPRIIGAYTSNVVGVTWYPSRYDYKDGLTGGSISLGMGVIYNLAEEFIFNR